jgi:hypothetical protein
MRTQEVRFNTRSCSNRFGIKETRVDVEEDRDMGTDEEENPASAAGGKVAKAGIESVKAISVSRLTRVRLRSRIWGRDLKTDWIELLVRRWQLVTSISIR